MTWLPVLYCLNISSWLKLKNFQMTVLIAPVNWGVPDHKIRKRPSRALRHCDIQWLELIYANCVEIWTSVDIESIKLGCTNYQLLWNYRILHLLFFLCLVECYFLAVLFVGISSQQSLPLLNLFFPIFGEALFRSHPKTKKFQDFSSHQILQHMHGVLNVSKKNY